MYRTRKKEWKVFKMTKIKIRSNPYNREISYLTMDEATGQWVDVRETDERSRLRETDSERSFLPFKIKEIINIIIKGYYVGREKVQLYFEGTQDEYSEVEAVCESDDVKDNTENHSDVADNAEREPKKAETAQISAFAPLNGNSIAPMIEMPTMRPKYGQTGMQIDILDLPGIPNEMKERMLREKCKRETDELLHAFTFNEHMCIALAPLVIAHMAWMYTFKVLDYCREHRIQVLKKLGRAVQHIRSEYMAMLRKDLDTEHIARIEREAERVHQECQTDFFIMWLNAKTQIINVYRDDPDATMKTDAFMAVLLIRILKEHNERMDAMIRERLGRCTNTIMNPWMVKLRDCMDAYTGGEELTIDTQIQLCTQIVHKNIAKIEWHTT